MDKSALFLNPGSQCPSLDSNVLQHSAVITQDCTLANSGDFVSVVSCEVCIP